MFKKNKYFYEGIIYVFLCYFTWCFSTISYRNEIWGIICLLCWILAQIIYICFVKTIIKYSHTDILRQINTLNSLGIIIFAYLAIMIAKDWHLIHFLIEVIGLIATILCRRIMRTHRTTNKKRNILFSLQNVINQHKSLILILCIALLLSIDWNGVQFKWDGLLYYKTCCKLSVFSISNLAIYGHIAQSFGLLVGLLAYLFKDAAYAMVIANTSLLLISTCAFYGIVKTLVPEKKEWQYTIASAPYAFSPFLLGMVNYYSLDYFCLCGFTIFLYFTFRKQWIYQFVAAFFLCFTKEPAIITYGFFCIGLVVVDLVDNKEHLFWKRIQKVASKKQYYLLMIPGVLWLVTYKIIGPWSAGVGGFEFSRVYALEKCKVLYLLNFNWVYVLLGLTGIIYLIIKRKSNSTNWCWLFPLLLSQGAFTVFSCAFNTVNHPRYSDTSVVTLYLIGILAVFIVFKNKLMILTYSLLTVLMLISSYYTLDPISKYFLPTFNAGHETMISTIDVPIGDGMIYNKQALGLEMVMNMSLNDALQQGDTIIFPVLGDSTYFFDGMAEVKVVKDYDLQTEYWNTKKLRRVPFNGDNTKNYRVYHLIDDRELLKKIMDSEDGNISLIYLTNDNLRITKEIGKSYQILDEQEYSYRGWSMRRITFRNKL